MLCIPRKLILKPFWGKFRHRDFWRNKGFITSGTALVHEATNLRPDVNGEDVPGPPGPHDVGRQVVDVAAVEKKMSVVLQKK